MSIKARVTLWYTLLMAVLTVVVLLIIFGVGGEQIKSSVRETLTKTVGDAADELDYDDEDGLDISDIASYENGVYILIYDEEGYPVQANLPSSLSADMTPALSNGSVSEFSSAGTSWLVYDVYSPECGVYIRGLASQTYADTGLNIIVRLAAILLPCFIALIIIGGYMITKRAFAPVKKIRDTAEEIAQSSDVSRRIGLEGGNDEIYELAGTFDKMLNRIEESFEREKQFTSDVSHELRTPVAVISSEAEYALGENASTAEKDEALSAILNQSSRISKLISQLLNISRAEAGRIKPNFEKINLSELLLTIAEEEQDLAAEKNIEITTDVQNGVFVHADETLLMRCFINLMDNAIAYGKPNGHITIFLRNDAGNAKGYVKDDGIGISKDDLDKIWERFYQADPSRSAQSGSFGLGLSMVKWIIKEHKGKIRAESEPGRGSTFYFEFPAI